MIHYSLSLCDFDLLTSEVCRVTRVLVKCFQFSYTRTHTPPFLLFHGDSCWASFPERELLGIIKLGFCGWMTFLCTTYSAEALNRLKELTPTKEVHPLASSFLCLPANSPRKGMLHCVYWLSSDSSCSRVLVMLELFFSVSQKKGCHPIHGYNFVNS